MAITPRKFLTGPVISYLQPQMEDEADPSPELDESIAKIDSLIREGKKVCLFVGRTPAEKLPSDRGEANPDEIWVSGDDCGVFGQPGEPIAGRIHLKMDFNNQVLVKKIQKRFDLIVVDFRVIKFFDDDFANRFSVMLSGRECKMLFEAATGFDSRDENVRELTFCPNSYNVIAPNPFVRDPKSSQSTAQKTKLMRFDKAAIAQVSHRELQRHLEKTFEHVELKEIATFPYWTNWPAEYFVVSHPKNINN